MSNDYYTAGAVPGTSAAGSSSVIRGEYSAIEAGFNKLSTLSANRIPYNNAGGTAQTNSAGFTFDGTTLTVPGINASGLTASRAVFTDGSKGFVSNAITGSGNVVMSASPTLTGTVTAAALALSGAITTTVSADTFNTITGNSTSLDLANRWNDGTNSWYLGLFGHSYGTGGELRFVLTGTGVVAALASTGLSVSGKVTATLGAAGQAFLMDAPTNGPYLEIKQAGTTVGYLGAASAVVGTGSVALYGASSGVIVQCVSNGVTLTNGAAAWAAYSDETLKDMKAFEPITNAVAKVQTLRTGVGRYNTDDVKVRRVFLIAQDVQKVQPEAVSVDDDGILLLRPTDLMPLYGAAISELGSRLTALEAA